MLITSDGIVLHHIKYSDTSLVVKIYTEKKGVKSFIIKGAFNKKSRFRAALFTPLALVNITFDDRGNEQLNYLKDLSKQTLGTDLTFDPARSAVLMFYHELLYKLLFDAGEDPLLFQFLKVEIMRLSNPTTDLIDLPLRFLLRLSSALGFFPENNYSEQNCYFSLNEGRFQSYRIEESCEMPQPESHYLSQLLRQEEMEVSAPRHTRNNLLHYLLEYYKIHNEHIHGLESAEILSSVLH